MYPQLFPTALDFKQQAVSPSTFIDFHIRFSVGLVNKNDLYVRSVTLTNADTTSSTYPHWFTGQVHQVSMTTFKSNIFVIHFMMHYLINIEKAPAKPLNVLHSTMLTKNAFVSMIPYRT